MLRQNGLALGGSLDNAIVLGETGVLNNALRFEDEFVRQDSRCGRRPRARRLSGHRPSGAPRGSRCTPSLPGRLEATDSWHLVRGTADTLMPTAAQAPATAPSLAN